MAILPTKARTVLLGLLVLCPLLGGQEGDHAFCIQAKVEKDVVSASDPVYLSVSIRNVGKDAASIHVASPHVFLKINLAGPSGEAIPRTPYGKTRVDLDSEGANCHVEVAAGGLYRTEVPEFSRSFDHSKIGKYRLTVSWRRQGSATELTSQEAAFEVVADDDARLKKSK